MELFAGLDAERLANLGRNTVERSADANVPGFHGLPTLEPAPASARLAIDLQAPFARFVNLSQARPGVLEVHAADAGGSVPRDGNGAPPTIPSGGCLIAGNLRRTCAAHESAALDESLARGG